MSVERKWLVMWLTAAELAEILGIQTPHTDASPRFRVGGTIEDETPHLGFWVRVDLVDDEHGEPFNVDLRASLTLFPWRSIHRACLYDTRPDRLPPSIRPH
jgi:hypothetical protein